jgi:ABC-2 type transport system permease protein/oleandomycin transport system permease protein
MTLVSLVGFLVGFRVHTDALGYLGGVVLVLLFGYSLSWVFATVGLAVKDPETAQAAAFPIMAPLVFASSVFVPVESMPSWLQPFAEHQPVSVVASAARSLMSGTPSDHYVVQALAWIAAIVAISAPLAVRRYRRVF